MAVIFIIIGLFYVGINSSFVLTKIAKIVTDKLEQRTQTRVSIGSVHLVPFKKIRFDEVYFSDQNKDTLLYVNKVSAQIKRLRFRKKEVTLNTVEFSKAELKISELKEGSNYDFLFELLSEQDSVKEGNWQFHCSEIVFVDGRFLSELKEKSIDLNSLNLHINNFKSRSDTLLFHVENFNFKSKRNLNLLSSRLQFNYIKGNININDLQAKTTNSELRAERVSLELNDYFESGNIGDLGLALIIDELSIGSSDLAGFVEGFDDNNLSARFSGEITGRVDECRGKKINLSIENFTRLSGDFYLNGLPDLPAAYIFFNLNESYANLREIRNLNLPEKMRHKLDDLPDFLDNLGEIRYKGNFTGFIDNFVAYGTVYSNLGTITSDVSFEPVRKQNLKVKGNLSGKDLQIGTIFQNSSFDKLSFAGDLSGTIAEGSGYDLFFEGLVNEIDYNDYHYKNIIINGELSQDQFNGEFAINDQNLQMNYSGRLDLSTELPVFNFDAEVSHLQPDKLNFFLDEDAITSFHVNANFEGSNIDNVKGLLRFSEISYKNLNDSVFVDTVEFDILPGEIKRFQLRSDLIDASINGDYNFLNIRKSLISFYREYLPNSFLSEMTDFQYTSDFNFKFQLKDLSLISRLFRPELEITPNIVVEGIYQPKEKLALLETSVPLIRYGRRGIENVHFEITANREKLEMKTRAERIRISEAMNIYNLSLLGTGKDNVLDFDVFWNNFDELTYSGSIQTSTRFKRTGSRYPHVTVDIEPSNMFFADSLWVMQPSRLVIDSSSVMVHDFEFSSDRQKFKLNGKISENVEDFMNLAVERVNLTLFEPVMGRSVFEGKINGMAQVSDYYNQFKLNMNLSIDSLLFKNGLLGGLQIESNWDQEQEKLASKLSLLKENKELIEAKGFIDPLENELDLILHFDKTPASILEITMPSTFNQQDGFLNGDVRLTGKTNNIKLKGELSPEKDAQLGLSYLNTIYHFNKPIRFNEDSILFDDLTFYDENANSGLLDGYITHRTFRNMRYNLNIQTEQMMVMNTTAAINEYFYGKAYAAGNLRITGFKNDVLITGNLVSERGTLLNIPFETGESAEIYDFVKFKGNEKEPDETVNYDLVSSGLSMDFDVELTPDARMQIIFNSQIGDVIKGTGSGNLQVKVDKNYNIVLYGNYVINEGDYLFTLQNVINKRFSIEKGSSLEWVGDPYDARININAVYKVKTTLHDLFLGTYENIDLSRRIPVDCRIQLSENLLQPNVQFSIDLPTAEERIKDEVSQLIATPEQVNRQVISLLMLGRFYTPEFFTGQPTTETGSNLVGATASELISNQLTNWLSQISDVWDIGINYRPGNEITDNQVELVLSTQILNDRVSLNGNIANNANPNSTNNSEFIGDFDVNIRLTDNGKFQFKAYNRSNDKLIYDTAPYTQGIGFSYREDFNSFGELIERYKAWFSRKKKNKVEAVD